MIFTFGFMLKKGFPTQDFVFPDSFISFSLSFPTYLFRIYVQLCTCMDAMWYGVDPTIPSK